MLRRVVALVVGLGVLCVVPARPLAQRRPASCDVVGQNLYVRDVLTDLYLWYTELPEVDPASFDSPEAYLDAVRYRPLDTSFSYITSRAANDAFYSDSQFIGFGFSTSLSDTALRVLQVFQASPAEDIGLRRGDSIVEINGRSVAALVASGQIDSAFGPPEIGVEADIAFHRLNGALQRAHMAKRIVTIPTVSLSRVYTVDGRKVGYLFFRNFVQPSIAALDRAFAEFNTEGITELVLDVRYNGGGLVDVARHLASLIGATRVEGQVFTEFFHNDKNTFRNQTVRFQATANSLNLDRLIVITGRASASASELVINALRPFMPVILIGDRTYGKPVGQYASPFCEKVLAPVAFTLRNARGEGDFFGGFAPDCAAVDDANHQLGDVGEASLGEALTFIATGACSAPPLSSQRSYERAREHRAVGWQSVVNAY
jgi:C-terminal peptidase prc